VSGTDDVILVLCCFDVLGYLLMRCGNHNGVVGNIEYEHANVPSRFQYVLMHEYE
jgi:hypothetical protein